jgi:hypothetical protein
MHSACMDLYTLILTTQIKPVNIREDGWRVGRWGLLGALMLAASQIPDLFYHRKILWQVREHVLCKVQ